MIAPVRMVTVLKLRRLDLIVASPLRLSLKLTSSTFHPSVGELCDLTEAAESLGLYCVYVSDHIVRPIDAMGWPFGVNDDYFEALTTLSYLAARTRRVRLGTNVIVAPLRNPVALAKSMACLDVLSGGRATMGIAPGYLSEEFPAVGAPEFRERGAVTDEVISICQGLWTEGAFRFTGRHFTFEPISMMPKPLQSPSIPIYVGGNSIYAIRRVSEYGNGWQPTHLSLRELSLGIQELNRLGVNGENERRIWIAPQVLIERTYGEGRDTVVRNAVRGTPEEIAASLESMRLIGADEVIADMRTTPTREIIRFLGELVQVLDCA